MPLIHEADQRFPAWCELESYEIIPLRAGESHAFVRRGNMEKLVVVRGGCTLVAGGEQPLEGGTVVDVDDQQSGGAEHVEVHDAMPNTVIVRLTGRWGPDTGGSGVFTAQQSDQPNDRGDPVWYPKTTHFDRHFHDCDEYWIIVEGQGIAVSEGMFYEVGPGDCIATGMGHHHDFPQVCESVRAVFFETTLKGRKRRGHLWEHTHGLAEPRHDRV